MNPALQKSQIQNPPLKGGMNPALQKSKIKNPPLKSGVKAEIISIGTELLVGSILNTNAQFLSRQLAENAVDVYHQTTVGDNVGRLVEAFEQAAARADLVITSGGLGPTADDVTIEALSKFTRKPLKLHRPTHRHVLELLRKHQYPMTSLIAKQCYLPQDSHVIQNNHGTAPGV